MCFTSAWKNKVEPAIPAGMTERESYMKKIVAFALLAACILTLGGCRTNEEKQDILDPYFTGKVLEKYDGSCLMEVTDVGSGCLAVGQQVVVHMNIENCPSYAIGDSLTICFDGKMTCSLPPQIVGVAMRKNQA